MNRFRQALPALVAAVVCACGNPAETPAVARDAAVVRPLLPGMAAPAFEIRVWLPVPATIVIGTDGVIDFQYVNPDYKVRVDPEVLVAAARAGLGDPS